MPVLGLLSYTLEVPSLDEGVRFYTNAGLASAIDGEVAQLNCPDQDRASIILFGGASQKRLRHVTLRAADLDEIAANTPGAGGRVIAPPPGFDGDGLWVSDPHGLIYHLIEHAPDPALEPTPPFAINAPGRIVRNYEIDGALA